MSRQFECKNMKSILAVYFAEQNLNLKSDEIVNLEQKT